MNRSRRGWGYTARPIDPKTLPKPKHPGPSANPTARSPQEAGPSQQTRGHPNRAPLHNTPAPPHTHPPQTDNTHKPNNEGGQQ